jgi:hypothetical protein
MHNYAVSNLNIDRREMAHIFSFLFFESLHLRRASEGFGREGTLAKRKFQRVLIALACLLGVTLLRAQNTTGTITGTITDPTGSVVNQASVMIDNTDTSVSRTTVTDGSGNYTATLLPPGHYTVTVNKRGFKGSTAQGLTLQIDQILRVNATLSPGSVTESVTVNAEHLALDTDSPTVGQVINSEQITDLPLNGRAFYNLLFLTPGAVESGGEQSTYRFGAGDAISLSGGSSNSNGYTVDGSTILDLSYNTPAYNLSIDGIQEFKAQTKNYSAEYGFSANQINISTKSGSKDLHGSVYEFLRNDALDARTFFNVEPQKVAPFKQNQFGYSLGGPVIIPHLYKGRDKTFFFANYEGLRISTSTVESGNVPTPDELAGTIPGTKAPVIDPVTGLPFPQDGSGNYLIPTSRYSRLGALAAKLFFPAPNASGPFNYVAALPSPTVSDQQTYRIDHTFGASDSMFIRATKVDANQTQPQGLNAISNQIILETARHYQVTETHTFTPNLLNQLRVAYLEVQGDRFGYEIPQSDIGTLGFSGTFQMPESTYPSLQFNVTGADSSVAYSGAGGAQNLPNNQTQPTWDFGDSVSWTHGRQTIGAGFQLRHWQLNLQNTTSPYGIFTFDGEFTNNNLADMLLGYLQQVRVQQPGPLANPSLGNAPHLHFVAWAPYFQDDVKVTNKLTLNLGLRYDFSGVATEEQNHFAWLNTSLPGGGLYIANPTIASQFGNGYYVYDGRRSNGPAPRNVCAPRIGFAYRPFVDQKTVIRGGYGLFYDTSESNEYEASTAVYPLAPTQLYTSNKTTGLYNTDTLFPSLTTLGPVTTADLSFLQIAATKKLDPYIADWSFGVEREVLPNTVLDVDYVGNKGTHLNIRTDPNQPVECVSVQAAGPGCAATITQRRPYQNLGTLVYEGWNGYSNYNALDVKVEHRGTDLAVLAAYTWSKAMDPKSATSSVSGDVAGWAGPQDSHNLAADYARSSYDVGQRLAASLLYSLPIGTGKLVGGGANRVENVAVGGWQINAIGILQGGFPFSVAANDVSSVNEAYSERANLVGSPHPSGFNKSYRQWFNPTAFAQPVEGSYGNSARNFIRAPGTGNLDLSLFKNFKAERLTIQFRMESFNVLNHPQFGFPDANVNDSTFAVVSTINTYHPGRQNQFALKLVF